MVEDWEEETGGLSAGVGVTLILRFSLAWAAGDARCSGVGADGVVDEPSGLVEEPLSSEGFGEAVPNLASRLRRI